MRIVKTVSNIFANKSADTTIASPADAVSNTLTLAGSFAQALRVQAKERLAKQAAFQARIEDAGIAKIMTMSNRDVLAKYGRS